jgi:hypothetical protein
MIFQERPPCLRGWFGLPHHVFGNGRLWDLDTKFEGFPVNPWCSPERIFFAHLSNQVANLFWSFWSAGIMSHALPSSKQAETFTVPCDHCLRFNDDQGRTPSGPAAWEPTPEHPIPGPESRSAENRTPQDIDLVSQGNNLNLELMPRSQTENKGREQEVEHESKGYQLNPATAMSSIWTEFSAGTAEEKNILWKKSGWLLSLRYWYSCQLHNKE